MNLFDGKEQSLIAGSHLKQFRKIYVALTGLISLFEIIMFIRGIFVFSFSNYKHYLYLCSYVFLFVSSLGACVFLFLGKKRDFSIKAYSYVLSMYAVAIVLWSLLISYLDMASSNPPIVYLTVIVTVGGIVVLEPRIFIPLLVISFATLIGEDAIGGFNYFISAAEYINISVFIIMSAIVGIRHFYVTSRDYKTTELLEASVLKERNRVSAISLQTIMSISNAVDAKDKYTKEHSQRVAEYSKNIALRLGFEDQKAQELYRIALLHDIGKIGVPDSILNCTGELSKEQFEQMKMHTIIGGDILKDLTILKNVDLGAKYHHERYDGTGYPSGLKGEDIPLEARIIAVADAFDAMNSNRVYRKKLSKEMIIEELINGKEKQFDPAIIDVFLPYAEEILKKDSL